MMAINTVAAGGGSILHFDGARMRVGPDTAGADPGPACYRRGGPLTVTDANVCVGKIQPAHFPAIFGPGGDQPLDAGSRRPEIRRTGAAKSRGDRRARTPQRGGGLPAHRRRQHGERDQAGLGAEGPRRHAASRCNASAAPAASTPAWSPTRWAWRRCSSIRSPGVLSAYGMGLADQTAMREQAVEVPLGADAHARAGGAGRQAGGRRRRGAGRARAPIPRACRRPRHRCICAMPAPRRR